MPIEKGPDFICVGMPKAGTSWLYEQLSVHPQFWMPRVKELQYLNHVCPRLGHIDKHLRQVKRRRSDKRELPPARSRAGDERQRAFLADAHALSGKPMDIARYAALFRHKGDLLSGDISPPYAGLSDETVAEIGAKLPDVKVVLLVRDPLERAWSGLSMNSRRGGFDPELLQDPIRFRRYFEEEKLADRQFPSRIVERWSRCAPEVRLAWFLFDDIVADPQRVRRDILDLLGADPGQGVDQLPPGHNRKANAAKLPLSDPIKAILLDHLADEIRACAALFEGSARAWTARYGL